VRIGPRAPGVDAVRLAELRGRRANLGLLASSGSEVREVLVDLGCEVWPASHCLVWRSWICRYGDQVAHEFLDALDEALAERVAAIEARTDAASAP